MGIDASLQLHSYARLAAGGQTVVLFTARPPLREPDVIPSQDAGLGQRGSYHRSHILWG